MHAPIARRVILSILLIALLLISGMLAVWVGGLLREDPEQEDTPPPPLVVTGVRLHRQDVTEHLRGYGLAQPIRRATVSAQLQGRVLEVPREIRVGARVTAGQSLLRIDPTEFNARLARAEANLAEAEEDLTRNRAELEEAGRKRESLLSDVRLAEAEVERAEELFALGAASESARDQALSRLEAARQRLSDNDRQVAVLRASEARLQASLRARNSELKLARTDLSYTTPTAPFDGLVEERHVEEGDLVQPGRALITLVDPARLELPIEVPASQAAALREGASVRLRTVSQPPVSIEGHVERVSPTIRPGTRTVGAYVVIDNETGGEGVVPGTFLTASIDGRLFRDVHAVPRASILDGDIYIERDGIAHRVTPRFFVYLDDLALTRDDLGEGAVLITTGLERLYDGAPVSVPRIDEGPAELELPATTPVLSGLDDTRT